MQIEQQLTSEIQKAVRHLFGAEPPDIQLQPTRPEFAGSHTLVCFPLTRLSRKSPDETAQAIGAYLTANVPWISAFQVVKGFLNISLSDSVWTKVLAYIFQHTAYGTLPASGREIMVEYSSPNTNKPLHLGHLRNNFLGWSVSEILKANGYTVHRVQIINDRGIHICKSMAAWKLFGNGETPQSSGMKGDHLVGKYYVEFDRQYKKEVKALMEQGLSEEEAGKQAPIMQLATDLLRRWEAKDEETLSLWRTMNGWVYQGFEATYRRMGVTFDKLYYESDTYLLGREEVLKGLQQGVFYKKEDGSVWVDLTAEGLDHKVLLRADGTSVYITQDIGTAILRFRDFPNIEGQIYTVGNEQEYHFKVLFIILRKLGYSWAEKCHHLSYGMVDLPTGKMKSREGTVVDADDLMDEMVKDAETLTRQLGKIEGLTEAEARELFETIGLGALKFFLLKVDPRKRMLFDPQESIQLQGFTGPFIQYTHARIKALLRKAAQEGISFGAKGFENLQKLEPAERHVVQVLSRYEEKVKEAALLYSPAIIANYAYELAREYNQFYQTIPVLGETDNSSVQFRLALSDAVARVIAHAMHLLGIRVPERM
ncbi:MAG: arginine--tRNA ligase [Cyclobacteriaceae bacterium]|nr:MAG: arginine--tRNA ligase [Cyclobacteriaceae bacterium]